MSVPIVPCPEKEEELVMLSALQHYLFCQRQCALIHLEGLWSENRLTAEGKLLHERVDQQKCEQRKTLRQATAVRLTSRQLGISGVADMVEFHQSDQEYAGDGTRIAVPLPGTPGFWKPFPVEYKHGRPKEHRADEVQLCAQAICLEEMLGATIPSGALFYGKPRRRMEVEFDETLRRLTDETARGLHALIDSGTTPPPNWGKWCSACSLIEECHPQILSSHKSAQKWLANEMAMASTNEETP